MHAVAPIFSTCHPLLATQDAVYKHLAAQGVSPARTGLFGFCWGSWLIFRESADATGAKGFACGVNCHPSLILEEKFVSPPVFGSISKLAAAASHPMMMMPCQGDPEAVQAGGDVEKQLGLKPFAKKCGFVPFTTMKHGFVSQGDVTNDEVRSEIHVARRVSLGI